MIDKLYPWAKDQKDGDTTYFLNSPDSCSVAAILELTQYIPQELITIQGVDFAEYQASVAALRTRIQEWALHGEKPLYRLDGLRRLTPVTLIREALTKCQDEFPAASTADLNFIGDRSLRDNLRMDISATNSALVNGEWKAATVLAGSIVEALLLWALAQKNQVTISAAVAQLGLKVSSKLEDWVLHQYIEVAAALTLITAETATQCRLAKDFRNLIHPGRAQRLAQGCNRGTALSAVAAVEHVITDLTP